MAKPAGKQTKPKCGAGQSCGFACIEASDTCTEKLDGAISKAAVEALHGHATAALATVATESTDFRGKSFAEVQSKFSANDAKHTIANTIVDHGGGITTQKVTLIASDSSGDTLTHTLLRMASNGDQPERIFTLADGMAKEYTDRFDTGYWNESRDAAVRAAISRPAASKAKKVDHQMTVEEYATAHPEQDATERYLSHGESIAKAIRSGKPVRGEIARPYYQHEAVEDAYAAKDRNREAAATKASQTYTPKPLPAWAGKRDPV